MGTHTPSEDSKIFPTNVVGTLTKSKSTTLFHDLGDLNSVKVIHCHELSSSDQTTIGKNIQIFTDVLIQFYDNTLVQTVYVFDIHVRSPKLNGKSQVHVHE